MEMIMKKALAKKNGKKGFTLVEVIVVLVILAILAAIAIPALTGYIDKANKRAVISEARSVQIALQTIASDAYGDGINFAPTAGSDALPSGYVPSKSGVTTVLGEIEILNGGTVDGEITAITWDASKLTGFKFTKSGTGGKVVTYASGKYIVG